MKQILGTLLTVVLAAVTLHAEPADNPVEQRYGASAYPWSNEIAWDNVVNILDHGGVADGITPNDAAFVSARDAAAATGGGIVYFPTGTYFFADSIGLKDGVVLRGDSPTVTDAGDPSFRPPSRLVFPKFVFDPAANGGNGTDPDTAFKFIGKVDGEAGKNTGMVHLDINRASIWAGGGGTGSGNVILMGLRSNNVASPQPWTVPTSDQHPWQMHPNRFTDNISALGYENVLVANNRLNDIHYWKDRQTDGRDLSGAPADFASFEDDTFAQPGYLINDSGTWRAVEDIFGEPYVFRYTNHYGITVKGSSGKWGSAPWEQPNLFYRGTVIRDNWIYCTMRVKIHVSGDGLVVKDNILKDREGKRRYVSPNGEKVVQNAATLENRGIDWRGHNVLVEGNEVEVFRHRLGSGSYMSVDGEGILHQEVHGSTIQNAVLRGNTCNAYIGVYKMPYSRNILVEDNVMTAGAYIMVQSDTNGGDFPMYDVTVRNNEVFGDIRLAAGYYSPGIPSATITGNRIGGTLKMEAHMAESANTKLDGSTAADVEVRDLAETTAIAKPAEGTLYADRDPETAASGETVTFTVLVTSPSVDVDQVKFYRGGSLLHTDASPPYTYVWTSDGQKGIWSAEIEQPEQVGGLDLYTASLLEEDPRPASPLTVSLTSPDPAGDYVAPVDLTLTADIPTGSAPLDRVEFYSGGEFLGADADTADPFTFPWNGVARGTYSLTAKAWDTDGHIAVSEPLQVFVNGLPDGIPSNVEATAYSDTEILLTWTNTATNATGTIIESSDPGSGLWEVLDTVGAAADSYLDSVLTPETAYAYRLRATNAIGDSDPSAEVQATTFATAPAAPAAPTGLSGRAVNADAIRVSWTAATGDPFGYRMEVRASESDPWTPLAGIPAPSTEYLHSGLSPDSYRLYRVQAWNNVGHSAWVECAGASYPTAFAPTFSASGNPWSLPGTIQFEDYNTVNGFWDADTANQGGAPYRSPDGVDIGGSPGNYTIGWIDDGEWLDYSVEIETAGIYDIDIRYASPNNGGSLSLLLDGLPIAEPVVFANTGAWGSYTEHTIQGLYLAAGHATLRAYVENSGFNLDWMAFTLTEPANVGNWAAAALAGESRSGAEENADGDPHPNAFDFLFGFDPTSYEAPLPSPAMKNGMATLRFPIAKGLDHVDWALQASSSLNDSAGWAAVSPEQMSLVDEEPGRIWWEARVPHNGSDPVFLRLILP